MPAQVSDHRFLQNVLGVAHVAQIGIGEPENAVAVIVQRGGGLYVFRALRGRMREKLLNPRGQQRKKLPKALPGRGSIHSIEKPPARCAGNQARSARVFLFNESANELRHFVERYAVRANADGIIISVRLPDYKRD